jgi:hypothetical protein
VNLKEDGLIFFTLAVGSVGMYSLFLPPLHEIAKGNEGEGEKQVLRESEMICAAHLLLVAGITAYLAKSPVPFFLAIILGASIFASYEYALAREIA